MVRLTVKKLARSLEAIYKFTGIPIKISMIVFTELGKNVGYTKGLGYLNQLLERAMPETM